ncbi:hypothetical protein BD413DRAFT_616174 [Trametes elegans]|nr:hypothetical protein BD413DRAFT_616174 [Trametes elegans]
MVYSRLLQPWRSDIVSTIDRALFPPVEASVRPRGTLEDLPWEVIEEISRLACTDGGRTGCSLSLVSKYVRPVARCQRFHSVSLLAGLACQLRRFVRALEEAGVEAQEEGARAPRVRHLCLDFDPATSVGHVDPNAVDWCSVEHNLMLFSALPLRTLTALFDRVRAEYRAALRPLLARVADSVETLTVLHRDGDYARADLEPFPVGPDGFPHLREFTCRMYLPSFIQLARSDDGETGRVAIRPMFPALRRMHVDPNPNATVDFWWWAANAPRLGWLRVNCDCSAPFNNILGIQSLFWVIEAMNAEFSEPAGAAAAPEVAPSFPELRTLIFTLTPNFWPGLDRGVSLVPDARARLSRILAEIFCEVRRPMVVYSDDYRAQDVSARLMAPHRGDRERWEMDEVLRRDWLERVAGGEGVFLRVYCTAAREKPGIVRNFWSNVWGEY